MAGSQPDEDLRRDAAAQNQQLGLAELCAAPGALCAALSVEDQFARPAASRLYERGGV